MTVDKSAIGRTVIAYGGGGQEYGRGLVISYCDAPTVAIETAQGERLHWRADLCALVERVPEPGTWGIVRAACVHDPAVRDWYHHPDGNWWPIPQSYAAVSDLPDDGARVKVLAWPDDWDSLVDPTLVREGL